MPLTKTTTKQNEITLSHLSVRCLYSLAIVFAATVVQHNSSAEVARSNLISRILATCHVCYDTRVELVLGFTCITILSVLFSVFPTSLCLSDLFKHEVPERHVLFLIRQLFY